MEDKTAHSEDIHLCQRSIRAYAFHPGSRETDGYTTIETTNFHTTDIARAWAEFSTSKATCVEADGVKAGAVGGSVGYREFLSAIKSRIFLKESLKDFREQVRME